MSDAKTFSWILLSVHERGGTRKQISDMADYINHAVPTEHEMQNSLKWLKERGLVREDGDKFTLTESGSLLVTRYRQRTPMESLNTLSDVIQQMLQE